MKEFFNGDTRERKYNQTAVEWLHSEYIRIFSELNPSTGKLLEIAYALEQAKEMENERVTEAYRIGRIGKSIKEFNETFKSE
jgi:predicted transcriptional regulator